MIKAKNNETEKKYEVFKWRYYEHILNIKLMCRANGELNKNDESLIKIYLGIKVCQGYIVLKDCWTIQRVWEKSEMVVWFLFHPVNWIARGHWVVTGRMVSSKLNNTVMQIRGWHNTVMQIRGLALVCLRIGTINEWGWATWEFFFYLNMLIRVLNRNEIVVCILKISVSSPLKCS